MEDWRFIVQKAPFLLLVIFRITGIMILAPMFGSRNIPRRIRALLAIVIATAVLPIVPTEGLSVPTTATGYVSAILGELSIGFVLGFAASLLFIGVQFGGHLVGQQMGMTLANVIDPLSNQQVSVVQQIQFLLAITLFILARGHHLLLSAVIGTFRTIPLMGFSYKPEMLNKVSDEMFGQVFVVAVKVAGPGVAALMLTSVAMAFIARAVPEMNIFNIGFGLRLAMGLVVITLTIPPLVNLLLVLFEKLAEDVTTLTQMMAT